MRIVNNGGWEALAVLAAVLAFLPQPVLAQAPSAAFDGHWNVLLACKELPDGAKAFSWKFAGTIKDGMLRAQYGEAGQQASLTVDGPVGADGVAMFDARGVTGPSTYNIGHARDGSPIHFHLRGQFGPLHGQAERIEQRPCTMYFDKS